MTLVMQKLKSQNGASIILALLLLLLCIMVGSSILAAGVSNAGKSKSHQEAQQEYFMVKSAIELVCGELEKMQYVGKYNYTGTYADGQYTLTYTMQKGEISGITLPSALGSLVINLPEEFKNKLSSEFNKLYAVPFHNAKISATGGDEVYTRVYDIGTYEDGSSLGPRFKADGTVDEEQTDSHKLEVKIDETSTDLFDEYNSNKALKETVDVTIEIVESDLSLKVTAEISGTGSNKMEAWMKLKTGSVFTVPIDSTVTTETKSLDPSLTWETKYIRKAVDR